MHVQLLGIEGTWRDVADSARTTAGLDPGPTYQEPSSSWKRKILLAEHSPIRLMAVRWKWIDLKYWVSVHFVRHKIGIEHFVKSQRPDPDRDSTPQSALVNHECIANFQAIINISRKRLCLRAAPETRAAWEALLKAIYPLEPELYSVCVRNCVYRGFCPEHTSCNWAFTAEYNKSLRNYKSGTRP